MQYLISSKINKRHIHIQKEEEEEKFDELSVLN